MGDLVLRRVHNGRLLSKISPASRSIVDIYYNQIDRGKEDCVLSCVHWEEVSGPVTSTLIVIEPDWKKPQGIDRKVSETLLQDRQILHGFLTDIYKTMNAKLVMVKLRPPSFVFVHSESNLFPNKAKIVMDKLRRLVFSCVPNKPEVKTKLKITHNEEPCRLIHHSFQQESNRKQETEQTKDQELTNSVRLRFKSIEEELQRQRDVFDKELSRQREQMEDLRTSMTDVIRALKERGASGGGNS